METIFKEGQKVYDQVNFPNIEGKILKLYSKDCESFPIEIYFGEILICYTIDGRADLYSVPTLSTKPYKVEFQGFEQKATIPNFEDVWDRKEKVYTSPDYNKNYSGYPSEELADAAEALRKLLFLRDYYNDDWQPDWKNRNIKWTIEVANNVLTVTNSYIFSRPIYFKTEQLADKFLEEQKELLEIAKPLL